MHIQVKEADGKKIDIRFPTRMFVNSVTATVGFEILKKQLKDGKLKEHVENVDLSVLDGFTAAQMRVLFREVNRAKVQLRREGIPLVEVRDGSGDEVIITL